MTANGRTDTPPRAVIDIGSNTVRMVIYGRPARAPVVLHNEKTVARLGRQLSTTGRIPPKSARAALDVLRRFARLIDQLRITDVETVATAAVREASNGEAFLDEVRALGFQPRLLSGKEEARAAAAGVAGAFPGAEGIVADLGGGSLELVALAGGASRDGITLPLGTLRLDGLGSARQRRKAIQRIVAEADFRPASEQTLYLVGGTLRAFGQLAMSQLGSPLEDPHGFEIDAATARRIARKLAKTAPKRMKGGERLSSSRKPLVPNAAMLVDALIDAYAPSRLVFSAWGLREGLLMQRLSPHKAAQDPLTTGIADFAARRGITTQTGAMVAGWIAQLPGPRAEGTERLRLATALLALASQRIEPNIRRRHAYDWALHKRWIGLEMRERAKLAAALLAQGGRTRLPQELGKLAPAVDLAEGISWGLAIRLLRRLGSASLTSLAGTRLDVSEDEVVLCMTEEGSALCGPGTEEDLAALAKHLDRAPRIALQGDRRQD